MRLTTSQQLEDTQRGAESTRRHLRDIQVDVLPRARQRIEASDTAKSETVGRQLESAVRLHDDQ
jgi:hypothetical protein